MSKRHRRERHDDQVSYMLLAIVNPYVPPARQAVSGSVIRRANCGHAVWVSPEGLSTFEGDNYTVCTLCDALSDEPMNPELSKPGQYEHYAVPGALAHTRADKGVAVADQMQAWMAEHAIKEL